MPETLVAVPDASKHLPRTGLLAADLRGDLDWTKLFDEQLVLTREHCEIGRLPGGKESTVKAPAKLFPDAQHKCAELLLPGFRPRLCLALLTHAGVLKGVPRWCREVYQPWCVPCA